MSKFTDRIDMRFQYTPAAATDLRKLFAKIQRARKEAAESKAKPAAKIAEISRRKQA